MRSGLLSDEEWTLIQENQVVQWTKNILDVHSKTFDVKQYGSSMLACLDETALHICDLLSVDLVNRPELFELFDKDVVDSLKAYIYIHNRILREAEDLTKRVKNEL